MTSLAPGLFKGVFDNAASDFVDAVQPLGRGAILSYPDTPYLRWKYKKGLGDTIVRDNSRGFVDAAQAHVPGHRGKQKISYTPKGEGSWKHQALATDKAKDDDHEVFPYRDSFLASDRKLFHDAPIAHRLNVVHHILPRYGIYVGTG